VVVSEASSGSERWIGGLRVRRQGFGLVPVRMTQKLSGVVTLEGIGELVEELDERGGGLIGKIHGQTHYRQVIGLHCGVFLALMDDELVSPEERIWIEGLLKRKADALEAEPVAVNDARVDRIRGGTARCQYLRLSRPLAQRTNWMAYYGVGWSPTVRHPALSRVASAQASRVFPERMSVCRIRCQSGAIRGHSVHTGHVPTLLRHQHPGGTSLLRREARGNCPAARNLHDNLPRYHRNETLSPF
jgi:hypothetical protein